MLTHLDATAPAARSAPQPQRYVVHVRPRHEAFALRHLTARGYEASSPLWLSRPLGEAKRSRPEPLFPGYLFVRVPEFSSGAVLDGIASTPGVFRVMAFGSRPTVVDDSLMRLLESPGAVPRSCQSWAATTGGPAAELIGQITSILQAECGTVRTKLFIGLLGSLVAPSTARVPGQRNFMEMS